jgi:hypothetical protein
VNEKLKEYEGEDIASKRKIWNVYF